MRFAPGQRYDFALDPASPSEVSERYERAVYKCNEIVGIATFLKGQEGAITSLDRFDVSDQVRLPVLYSTRRKPNVISITLDRKTSLYPRYNMDFEWPTVT